MAFLLLILVTQLFPVKPEEHRTLPQFEPKIKN
jgi:hypothetical protein